MLVPIKYCRCQYPGKFVLPCGDRCYFLFNIYQVGFRRLNFKISVIQTLELANGPRRNSWWRLPVDPKCFDSHSSPGSSLYYQTILGLPAACARDEAPIWVPSVQIHFWVRLFGPSLLQSWEISTLSLTRIPAHEHSTWWHWKQGALELVNQKCHGPWEFRGGKWRRPLLCWKSWVWKRRAWLGRQELTWKRARDNGSTDLIRRRQYFPRVISFWYILTIRQKTSWINFWILYEIKMNFYI